MVAVEVRLDHLYFLPTDLYRSGAIPIFSSTREVLVLPAPITVANIYSRLRDDD